ncbi:MAG: outer membrane beta-barrel protein [Bryobacteraceae bacterium]
MRVRCVVIAVVLATATMAQDWELGGSVGYGAYRSATVFGPNFQTATAEILNRFTAGAVIGQEPYDFLSGELRWTYQDGHAVLTAAGVREEMDAHSHTVTYDLLFHFRRRERRLRPFFAAGVGIKGYIANGPSPQQQPLAAVATLVERDEWKPVFDLGGGVKYRLADHVQLRLDFRDYLTTFPKLQIVPSPNSTARGIFQQFTPMLGVSYMF